jgi:hypothetical protein
VSKRIEGEVLAGRCPRAPPSPSCPTRKRKGKNPCQDFARAAGRRAGLISPRLVCMEEKERKRNRHG